MRRNIIFGLTVAGILLASWVWLHRDTVVTHYTITPFRYGFELRNTSSELLQNVSLEVFAPAEIAGRQRVLSLKSNQAYTDELDQNGNNTLHFDIEMIPPYGTKMILVSGEVEIASPGEAVSLGVPEQFLVAETYVQVDHEMIQQQAKNLRMDDEGFALRVADFVGKHIKNVGFLVKDRGAVYALSQAKGDCTEYMSLFSALARAGGVPTRNLAGFRINPEGARLSAGSYHNWAEYYDGRRWVLVDPQNKIINSKQEEYLTFRVLNKDSSYSTTQRFFAADARLQVKFL